MGLPPQLDGLPDKLQLKNPVMCPHCRKQLESLKKLTRDGEVVAVCRFCKKEVSREFLTKNLKST